jgi:hypothetical protein
MRMGLEDIPEWDLGCQRPGKKGNTGKGKVLDFLILPPRVFFFYFTEAKNIDRN